MKASNWNYKVISLVLFPCVLMTNADADGQSWNQDKMYQKGIPDTKTLTTHSTHAFKPEVFIHPNGSSIRVLKKIPKEMSLSDLQRQGYIVIEKNMSQNGKKLTDGTYNVSSGSDLHLKHGIVVPNC